MRRVTFTKAVTLKAVYGYEQAIEEGTTPVFHKITFEKGESVNLFEWEPADEFTNFATDDSGLMARVTPGDSNYDVVYFMKVPYDCHEAEPAFAAVEKPFRQAPVPQGKPPEINLAFLQDSGSIDDEDLIDFLPATASTA